MKTTSYSPGLCCLSLVLLGACTGKQEKGQGDKTVKTAKPNVILFLVDDLGWKGLGCYGSTFYETPNIDRFAQHGRLFTNAYAPAAVSSPSRASILTGKNPARLHLTDWTGPAKWHPEGELNTPDFQQYLPLTETTLAEAFKKEGYSTCFLGKWHVGDGKYLPGHQGFDVTKGVSEAGGPPSYFYPYYNEAYKGTVWPAQIEDLAKTGHEGEYLTERLTREAVHYLDTVKSPFFLYFSHFAVHRPLQARDSLVLKYREKARSLSSLGQDEKYMPERGAMTKTRQDHPVFAAMVETVDNSFGHLIQKLKEINRLENTIIVFTSDNGGLSTTRDEFIINNNEIATSVKPLRAGKGWLYEGGIRVPLIIGWAGKIKPGKEEMARVSGTDLYPTLLSLAGIKKKPEQHLDARDLAPLLREGKAIGREKLYYHYPHYHPSGQDPASAIISGNYKFIHFYEEDVTELYNLVEDMGETHDLAKNMPGLADSLQRELERWLDEVGAQEIK